MIIKGLQKRFAEIEFEKLKGNAYAVETPQMEKLKLESQLNLQTAHSGTSSRLKHLVIGYLVT